MVITMISPKTEKQKTEASDGDNGNGPAAGSDESAENGEHAGGGEPAAAGKCSGRARQGPLIKETVSGKIMGATLAAAWEALSLNKVIWWADDFSVV